MSEPLKIVMIASECVPFVKTGGLADVVGALPKALKEMGHEVHVILPKYQKIDTLRFGLKRLQDNMGVWMGEGQQEWCSVDVADLEGVPVYFIESWKHFGRDGIYNDANHRDYTDNARRFSFLSRAALQLCTDRNLKADIIHAHDWQTALACAYQKVWHWNNPIIGPAATILTIHNIQYQGLFGRDHYPYVGLRWENFTPDKFEDHGNINFLKGGIYFADMVNTVSPTYAYETRTSDLGEGMGHPLYMKGDRYIGILNGVDYADWNPETDPLIPAQYSREDLSGKAICKAELQRSFGLEMAPDMPIVGVVSRFADQKGLDLFYEAIHQAVNRMRVQFVVLGSGDKDLEWKYMQLPSLYPGRVGSFIGYDNTKAHWIEAGCDFFAMPSRFEPCGLNQLYSLRYGTLPIVRNTGGLADTVEQYDEQTGAGTGFKHEDNTPAAIADTIGWAVSTYYDRKHHLKAMIDRAMQRNFDWQRSAEAYVEMYRRAIREKEGA